MQNRNQKYLSSLWEVIIKTSSGFLDQKILKLSSSLAYTTIFSLAPMLLVILYGLSFFYGNDAIDGAIYTHTHSYIGKASAEQLQSMIKSVTISQTSSLTAYISIGTLLFAATSVFAEIQDSINTIWGIRPKKHSSFIQYLKTRLLSFGVIVSLGFILLVSLGFSSILDILNNLILERFKDFAFYFVYGINSVVTFIIITLLFGSIYTILPDAEIKFKQVKIASITSALFFMIGKYAITFYISNSNISSVFGAAGSLVILMIWVYYSSVILYTGSLFAFHYAVKFETPIKSSDFAEKVTNVEVSLESKTIQDACSEIEKKSL